MTNGTVIEISLTGVSSPPLSRRGPDEARYRNPRQARNHLWRTSLTRLPSLAIYRIFSGANDYARTVLEKTACLDAEGYHHRR